jgi:enoyl-CoA hydratase/carnithine racemase
MRQMYRTLRVVRTDEGVLSVVIDAPPMNLIGPELVRDLVTLLSELDADANIRVMVLESARPGVLRAACRPDQGRGVHRRGG